MIKAIAILAVFAGVTAVALYLRQAQLSPTDSDALIGGQLESGFRATGYLITFTGPTSIEYCGATLLDSRTAVTAAHCLDANGARYFGLGEFNSNRSDLYPVSSVQQKPGWDRRSSNNDLALFSLATDVPISTVARLESSAPLVGCGYRVVAYGRDNPNLNSLDNDRERKSAEICINNIVGDVLVMYAPRGGICLGDSGSPIYIDNTNRLIGVVSAVRKPNDGSPTCFTGNTAFITRVDTGLQFVAETVGQSKLGEFTSSNDGSNFSTVSSSINPNTATSQPNNQNNGNQSTFSSFSAPANTARTSANNSGINVGQNPNVPTAGADTEGDFLLLVLGVAILLTIGGIIYLAFGLRTRR